MPATKLDYSAHYAKFHPETADHRNGLTLLHRRMLGPFLPADRSAAILDVGCGRGYVLQDLATLGYTNASGIEVDPGQANAATANGMRVELVQSTEEFLCKHESAYTTILLLDVLEHVPRENQPAFLRAVARALKPGGKLICTVPNAASGIGTYWLHNDYTHQTSFTQDSLEFILGQGGFTSIACSGVEFFLRPKFLFWLPSKRTISWILRCCFRIRRRGEFIAELGWNRGRQVILTPNLFAVAERQP
jgi:SAM-dependent methyltransferase